MIKIFISPIKYIQGPGTIKTIGKYIKLWEAVPS